MEKYIRTIVLAVFDYYTNTYIWRVNRSNLFASYLTVKVLKVLYLNHWSVSVLAGERKHRYAGIWISSLILVDWNQNVAGCRTSVPILVTQNNGHFNLLQSRSSSLSIPPLFILLTLSWYFLLLDRGSLRWFNGR